MSPTPPKHLVEAAFGRKPGRIPVWFLRQAGRYLPEYREIRAKLSFMELCKSPKMAAEVTLQPLRRFDLDAAIIFCDILIPPTGMGQELTFDAGHGPRLNPPLRSGNDIARLQTPDCSSCFEFLGEAIERTKQGLEPQQTMIGFAGAPFTVASYMIEGQGSKLYTETKRIIYNEPEAFEQLMRHLANVTIDYLSLQVRAGADALMLFDTWAGNLTPHLYQKHVAFAVERIVTALQTAFPHVPVTYYPGQGSDLYSAITTIPMNAVAIDWRVPLDQGISKLKSLGLDVSIQGNLDPQMLMADPQTIRREVELILDRGRLARGHIFNVGHGLLPHIEPHKIKVAIDSVREWELHHTT